MPILDFLLEELSLPAKKEEQCEVREPEEFDV